MLKSAFLINWLSVVKSRWFSFIIPVCFKNRVVLRNFVHLSSRVVKMRWISFGWVVYPVFIISCHWSSCHLTSLENWIVLTKYMEILALMNVYNVVHNWLHIRAFPKDIWVLPPKNSDNRVLCMWVGNLCGKQ